MDESRSLRTPYGTYFWYANDETRITLAIDDPELNDPRPGASGPGAKIVWSTNKRSADYHPRYFNRACRKLVANGRLAPPECEEGSRRWGQS